MATRHERKGGLTQKLENTADASRSWFRITRETSTSITIEEYVRAGSPGFQKAYPASPPEHIHPGQTETFEVVSGVMGFYLDGKYGTIKPGEKAVILPGAKHFFYNAGDKDGKDLHIKFTLEPKQNARTFFENFIGLSYDYGNVEKVPIPQIFLTLIEAGDTLPSVPPPVLAVIRKAVLPFARLVGYKATYPEYTSTK